MERFICIHGHYYQPPRENPWLEFVEVQDSAYPYHDWNERITAECYAPNGAARVLDGKGQISRIINNYARTSFNFGPTLLSWLEEYEPAAYRAVLAADQESQANFAGHGSALAQGYNHIILPLANERDKYTQVRWGLYDFRHRFGRQPEAMWLPETAADVATLEVLAEHGLRFAILAPHQAARVRRIGGRSWADVSGGRIDPTRAYRAKLPSGRTIDLFFYDGPIARAVAFEGLLASGEKFANRLVGGFSGQRSWAQLVHIATDGETYGHHHRHGDMALAYALQYIEENKLARLTNYGEFLDLFPPTHEVEIVEDTSWSCSHGVERWRSDCGCNAGHAGWNQQWRGPLREALDWLRDELAPRFEAEAGRYLRDPWAARDDYIEVILDRSPESLDRFLDEHSTRLLAEHERVAVLKLLGAQRMALLMYTSCGWFFDEISGLETTQVVAYAGRALQLAREALGLDLESGFVERLARAPSNLREHASGAAVYEKYVRPAKVDLEKVTAHYAISSLFENYADVARVYAYDVRRRDLHLQQNGRERLAVGRARVASRLTGEAGEFSFGVLHLGGHNLAAGVRPFQGEQAYAELVADVQTVFGRADLAEVLRLLDRHFGEVSYSLKTLFRDEQRRVLEPILEATLSEAENAYRQIYQYHAPLMRFLGELNAPLPKAFIEAAEVVVNANLKRALRAEEIDPAVVRALLEEARQWKVELDAAGLAYVAQRRVEKLAARLRAGTEEPELPQHLVQLLELVGELPFEVDLWNTQNLYYEALQAVYGEEFWRSQVPGDEDTLAWLDGFGALGDKLGIKVGEMSDTSNPASITALAEEVARRRHVPRATYRLQFNGNFSFADAAALVPYLEELGISDCYTSPIYMASPGSMHGYDVLDYSQLNPELGGEEGFTALSQALRERRMGLVMDVVPNHMGIANTGNRWWMDVLENGPSSTYASYFDIDWQPVKRELGDRVLLPVLEEQYGHVLESGKLQLGYEEGAFFVNYYETKLPVAPDTYSIVLNHVLNPLLENLGPDDAHLRELQSILTALGYLPPSDERDPERMAERDREKEIIKHRLAALYEASTAVRLAIDSAVRAFNGNIADPTSFDLLDELLSRQAFRPAFWRVAAEEINYRRFFDINTLVAVREELPQVFADTHRLVFRLLQEGKVTGLRVDHCDGLWNPARYFHELQETYVFEQLQARLGLREGQNGLARAVAANMLAEVESRAPGERPWPLWVVAEKILSAGELLPPDWAVDGTTGYDFLAAAGALFVDRRARQRFNTIYSSFIGNGGAYRNIVNSSKKMTMLIALASEINSLAYRLERLAERNRRYRDFTLNSLTFAIREIIACLPVYRTYTVEGLEQATPRDQRFLEQAIAEAKRRNPRTAPIVFDFVGDALLLRPAEHFPEEERQALTEFAMKFQQVSGPVTAKGVEDTAFYTYNRLVALNEVGADPDHFGGTPADFHRHNAERCQSWPHTMLATSTHDTKRSEDVRARIAVLSELPEEWAAALERWRALNAKHKVEVAGISAPDANAEYLFYQSLLGVWPFDTPLEAQRAELAARLAAYMAKATKEAKVHTSWVNPNEGYDAAVQDFVARLVGPEAAPDFLEDAAGLARRVAFFGQWNSLSQTLLKLASPGVPDFYQGSELWDFSLVDPDNRRPVDYERRRHLLAQLRARLAEAGQDLRGLADELVGASPDGRIKLYLVHRLLDFRRAQPDLFAEGQYLPLEVGGERAEHALAFARRLGERQVVAVAPRLVAGLTNGEERPPLGDVWGATALLLPEEKGRRYRNLLTGEEMTVADTPAGPALRLADALRHFPVALLERLGE
ncbi:MAG: malto-oligosyltrehalose synthase [Chloroflexota bacterium]